MIKFLRGLAVAASSALAVLAAARATAQTLDLTIVHVNDLSRAAEVAYRGGVAKLAAIIARERAGGRRVFVTHGGNAISPSLLSGFDQGANMIDLLNRAGLDLMAVGNHEFDYGPAVLSGRALEAGFKLLTANARQADGSPIEGTQASWVVEIDGFKLGFLGLTRKDTPQVSQPGTTVFEAPLPAAERLAAALREGGADLVVALANLNRDESDALVRSGLVDLVLGSSNEVLRFAYDGRTAFAASSPQANQVAIVDLRLERRDLEMAPEAVLGTGGETNLESLLAPTIETHFYWRPSFRTIDTIDVAGDPEIELAVQRYLDALSDDLRAPIGVTRVALDTREVANRSGDTAFASLVADAMRAAVGADAALLNAGSIRGDRTYAAGTLLTRRNLLQEMPFRNRVVLLRVNGGQLLAAIENGLSEVELATGRFPHLSGMSVAYDAARPAGDRIVSATIGGGPLADDRMYRLATLDFIAAGGDGFTMLAKAERLIGASEGPLATQAVADYIVAAGGAIEAPAGDRLIRR